MYRNICSEWTNDGWSGVTLTFICQLVFWSDTDLSAGILVSFCLFSCLCLVTFTILFQKHSFWVSGTEMMSYCHLPLTALLIHLQIYIFHLRVLYKFDWLIDNIVMCFEGGDRQSAAYEAVGSTTAWSCLSTRDLAAWTPGMWEDIAGKCNSWRMFLNYGSYGCTI